MGCGNRKADTGVARGLETGNSAFPQLSSPDFPRVGAHDTNEFAGHVFDMCNGFMDSLGQRTGVGIIGACDNAAMGSICGQMQTVKIQAVQCEDRSPLPGCKAKHLFIRNLPVGAVGFERSQNVMPERP